MPAALPAQQARRLLDLRSAELAEPLQDLRDWRHGDCAVKSEAARKHSICVLAFSNICDDPRQEYFSNGISEDIITDLSKVSALGVTARNTSFQFRGKSVDRQYPPIAANQQSPAGPAGIRR